MFTALVMCLICMMSVAFATEMPDTSVVPDSYWDAEQAAAGYLAEGVDTYGAMLSKLAGEGFTAEEAAYGAVNCTDWTAVATGQAKGYLTVMAFSREGLIDLLCYDGFTTAMATAAVDGCGADWNEQAVRAAEEYRVCGINDDARLCEVLAADGFTIDEALYAIEN